MNNNRLFIPLTIVSAMVLAGCSSPISEEDIQEAKDFLEGIQESQNKSVDTETALNSNYLASGETTTGYGSARIGGEIVPTVSGSRMLRSGAYATRDVTTDSFTVYLLKGDGARVKLDNLQLNIQINPNNPNQFIVHNLADNAVFVVKISDGNKVLEALSYIEGGAASNKIQVTPHSTVIARTVEDRLVNAYFETGGEVLSASYANDLTSAITESLKKAEGLDTSAIEAAIAEGSASEEAIQAAIKNIVVHDDVASSVNVLETSAAAAKYQVKDGGPQNNEKARTYIRTLFHSLSEEEGDIPEYIVKFFGDTYFQRPGFDWKVRDVLRSLYQGLEFKKTGLSDQFSLSEALKSLGSELQELYSGIARIKELEGKSSLTAAEKRELHTLKDEFKQEHIKVILGVFPAKEANTWVNINADTMIGVPQSIALAFYVLDVYLGELNSQVRNQDGQLEDHSQYDFNPDPLLAFFGWDPNNIPLEYQGVTANWLDIRTDRYWSDSENKEKDVLAAYTCVETLGKGFELKGVSLSIPTGSNSENTVSMNAENHGDQERCFNLDPWRQVDQLVQDNANLYQDGDFTDWNKAWKDAEHKGLIVNDFGSGEYVVTVRYAQNGANKEDRFAFDKLVIRGLRKLRPKLTYPLEEPRHPEGAVSDEEWQTFQTAQNNFQMTTVASGSGFKVSWEPARLGGVDLPDNVVAVYALDVGRDVCEDTDKDGFEDRCEWKHVWSSWELGSLIFGTSVVVPVELPKLTLSQSPYHVNLRVEFVDKRTGEHVGAGGDSHAPLRVGEALDFTKTFSLVGKVDGIPNNAGNVIRAAIMEEACFDDPNTFQWVCRTTMLAESDVDKVNGTYRISMTLGEAMKNSTGGHRQIVLYIDQNNDNKYTVDPNDPWKRVDALMYPDTWLNLEVWGGMLHATGEKNCKYDQLGNKQGCDWYDVLVFPGAEVAGPAFRLGGYFGQFDLTGTVTGTDANMYVAALERCDDGNCQLIATAKVDNGSYLFNDLNIRDLMNPPPSFYLFKDSNDNGQNDDHSGQQWPNNFWFGDWDGRLHVSQGEEIYDEHCGCYYHTDKVVNPGDTVRLDFNVGNSH